MIFFYPHNIHATVYACIMYLDHFPDGDKTNRCSGIGIRFLDLSFNRLSEGNCARILAGAIAGLLKD